MSLAVQAVGWHPDTCTGTFWQLSPMEKQPSNTNQNPNGRALWGLGHSTPRVINPGDVANYKVLSTIGITPINH